MSTQDSFGMPSFQDYNREQLVIYARELNQHYRREQEMRADLEQRVRELEALNRLFQQHLAEYRRVTEAVTDVVESVQRLAQQMTLLHQHTPGTLPSGWGEGSP